MRSRYTAYLLGRHDYLLQTWHPDARPKPGELGGTQLTWIGLQIVGIERGSADDMEGTVSFIASYRSGGKGKQLHECSRFMRVDGAWAYLDGDCEVRDIGRNDACPCGSGRKFKRCCGA